ncbi:aldo/keto reductase [candidate division KSB1 bacterium]|nr:aldo/keto reductase [candidate division KSB1 bacterium]
MAHFTSKSISRRSFLKDSAVTALGLSTLPYLNCGKIGVKQPLTREFGRLQTEVTTLGLGGQASIQWTPADVDPVKIILKAFNLGVTYFDTSNVYGPSQMNYGKAFRQLRLIPGESGYNESLRQSIFLTSKTGLRWSKGFQDGVRSFTNGPKGTGAIDDVKRTLSQVFGDGQGNYPKGAYINMVLIHALDTFEEIDAVYEGLDNPDPKAERIGALAGLLDLLDGTNRTGLNSKEEKLIRHIGFSGHHSPPVMMEMIQRDSNNILDGMLIAINANDRLNFNMQYNAIPVAAAKNMGIIAMKVFADGAMYTKEANWSWKPEHVVRTVGSQTLPSRELVHYSLTTPGIHTAIIGIGQIDDNPKACQLTQNMSAAQIRPNSMTEAARRDIEMLAGKVKDGKTNYFQLPAEQLTPAQHPSVQQDMRNNQRVVQLTWKTAFAGNEPIRKYEIWRDNQKITDVEHHPQTTHEPFTFDDLVADKEAHSYNIITVDASNNTATTTELVAPTIG